MKKPIFKKKDFILCDVPAPIGYPQSQTRCGLAIYNGRILLSSSPYPEEADIRKRAIKKVLRILTKGRLGNLINGEYFENPCLYEGIKNEEDIPIKFVPLADNPLMPTPPKYKGIPSFCSDPQVFVDNDKVCVFNRIIRREPIQSNGTVKYHYLTDIYKIDGELNKGSFIITDINIFRQFSTPCISPTIIRFREWYYFMYVDSNSYNDGETFGSFYFIKSKTLEGLKTEKVVHRIQFEQDSLLPWHFSLFEYKDKLYAIVACVERGIKKRCIQMLGVISDDIENLRLYEHPLTTMNSYRSAAMVLDDGRFVLYNATVNEFYNNDKSVDGRNIVMANMLFDEMLNSVE